MLNNDFKWTSGKLEIYRFQGNGNRYVMETENKHVYIPMKWFFSILKCCLVAYKYLQYGLDKCKVMVVGKRTETFLVPRLVVDTWETSHSEDGELKETFGGKKPMANTNVHAYLGMEISQDGRNMKNIIQRRNRQSGKKKMITNLLRPLEKYTFECGFIFLKSLIRSRIEENQRKNIFKAETGIQVPFHLMYLDGAQVPAKYQIQRYKLNFLQYVLQQEESSILYTMLEA